MNRRIGMNQGEIEAFVAKLAAGGDFDALAAASGVDPAWFELNRSHLLKLAGVAPEEPAAPAPEGKRKAKG